MTNFTPEKLVTTFTDKQGSKITIRYPKLEDLDQLTVYINNLSQENTYIRFSGEEITKDEEASFLEDVLKKIETRDDVMLVAIADETVIGAVGIHRNTINKQRSRHVAEFGISLAKEYRGRGIGERLAEVACEEAKKTISGLRMIYLTVFAINDRAQALYSKLGFQEVGRIPEFILHNDEYIDEIVMVKKV